MQILVLRLVAPFSAFRTFSAGYRSVYPTIPHSAARGLVLNLAAIDDDHGSIPAMDIAVGLEKAGEVGVVYTQLHRSNKKNKKFLETRQKLEVTPISREVLVGATFLIAVRAEDELIEKVRAGLRGELDRFGIPFAGDNQQTYEAIEEVIDAVGAWFYPSTKGAAVSLSTKVDYKANQNTKFSLFSQRHGLLEPEALVHIAS